MNIITSILKILLPMVAVMSLGLAITEENPSRLLTTATMVFLTIWVYTKDKTNQVDNDEDSK